MERCYETVGILLAPRTRTGSGDTDEGFQSDAVDGRQLLPHVALPLLRGADGRSRSAGIPRHRWSARRWIRVRTIPHWFKQTFRKISILFIFLMDLGFQFPVGSTMDCWRRTCKRWRNWWRATRTDRLSSCGPSATSHNPRKPFQRNISSCVPDPLLSFFFFSTILTGFWLSWVEIYWLSSWHGKDLSANHIRLSFIFLSLTILSRILRVLEGSLLCVRPRRKILPPLPSPVSTLSTLIIPGFVFKDRQNPQTLVDSFEILEDCL